MLPSWTLLEQAFAVETIMTPRTKWLFWDSEQSLEPLWKRARKLRVDTIPVIENDQITGLLMQDQSESISLTEDWLVANDTPIHHVLQRFATATKPSLLVFQRQRVITGIVTPADFNKAPARTLIYSLLAELEMAIASVIGNHFKGRQEEILKLIEPIAKPEIKKVIAEMKREDLEIEIIHLLYLSDMVNIIRKAPDLREEINVKELETSKKVEKTLNGLIHLRNDVVHPVNLVVGERRGIQKLDKQIQCAASLLPKLIVA